MKGKGGEGSEGEVRERKERKSTNLRSPNIGSTAAERLTNC